MTKRAHTPGPWTITHDNSIVGADYPGQGRIGKLNRCRTNKDRIDDTEANAALIAAAPELLEALEGCKQALARMIDKHDPDSIEAEWIGHAHEAIINAGGA